MCVCLGTRGYAKSVGLVGSVRSAGCVGHVGFCGTCAAGGVCLVSGIVGNIESVWVLFCHLG